MQEKVGVGSRASPGEHDVGDSEDGSLSVAVGTVKEDTTSELAAVARRGSLSADPKGEVDHAVDELRLCASSLLDVVAAGEALEVDEILDVRAEEGNALLDDAGSVRVVLEELADFLKSLTFLLEDGESPIGRGQRIRSKEGGLVVSLNADGEGGGVAVVKKGGGRVRGEVVSVRRGGDVLRVAELLRTESEGVSCRFGPAAERREESNSPRRSPRSHWPGSKPSSPPSRARKS